MSNDVKFWFKVTLRIIDSSSLHEEVISVLGPGTECHKKGDAVHGKPGKHWSRDLWMLSAPVDESSDVNEHLKWLANYVDPHQKKLQEWREKGARIDVFVTYACNERDRGFAFHADSIWVFAKLGLTIEVSVSD